MLVEIWLSFRRWHRCLRVANGYRIGSDRKHRYDGGADEGDRTDVTFASSVPEHLECPVVEEEG
jgi:hypothetical protein